MFRNIVIHYIGKHHISIINNAAPNATHATDFPTRFSVEAAPVCIPAVGELHVMWGLFGLLVPYV